MTLTDNERKDIVSHWYDGLITIQEAWGKLTPEDSGTYIDLPRSPGLIGIDPESGKTIVFTINSHLIYGPVLTQDQAYRAIEWATKGHLIQVILSDLSPDDREMLVSGVSGEEFDKLFAKA